MVKNCEFCGKEHEGEYGSGRFCSAYCARQYSQKFITKESRERQIAALNDPANRKKLNDQRKANASYHKPKFTRTAINDKSPINTTKRLGIIGEIATIKKFVDRSIPVYLPYGDTEAADVIADFDGKLQRIQVKSTCSAPDDNSFVNFTIYNSGYRIENGRVIGVKKPYTKEEVDYFSLYDYNSDRVFLLKNNEDRTSIAIRYTGCNGERYSTSHMADDYDFDTVMDHIESSHYIEPMIFDVPYKVIDEEE